MMESHHRAGDAPPGPRAVVLMGPAGSGKSTVGRALADALGWSFVEGDGLHLPASVARMQAGLPLGEAERTPWLAALAAAVEACLARGESVVVACSALRRAYRAALVPPGRASQMRWVYLHAPAEVLARRVGERTGHFFPAALLATQIEALEAPTPGEAVAVVDATLPVDRLVAELRARLEAPGG